jgi:hypothetical protein
MNSCKRIAQVAVACLLGVICASCKSDAAARKLSAEEAVRFAPYAMMAANSYHNKDRERFPVEDLGWVQVDLDDNPTKEPTYAHGEGAAYDVFKSSKSPNEFVFAVRGTDWKGDYVFANFALPISGQYKSVVNRYEAFAQKHPGAKVTVVGHSLGGGIALSISVRQGVDAVVFDTSPRIFDGLGDHHKDARRESIFQTGEVLQGVRSAWPKYREVVNAEDNYACNFDFGTDSKFKKHSSQRLAFEMLKLGATRDAALKAVLDKVKPPAAPEPPLGD